MLLLLVLLLTACTPAVEDQGQEEPQDTQEPYDYNPDDFYFPDGGTETQVWVVVDRSGSMTDDLGRFDDQGPVVVGLMNLLDQFENWSLRLGTVGWYQTQSYELYTAGPFSSRDYSAEEAALEMKYLVPGTAEVVLMGAQLELELFPMLLEDQELVLVLISDEDDWSDITVEEWVQVVPPAVDHLVLVGVTDPECLEQNELSKYSTRLMHVGDLLGIPCSSICSTAWALP